MLLTLEVIGLLSCDIKFHAQVKWLHQSLLYSLNEDHEMRSKVAVERGSVLNLLTAGDELFVYVLLEEQYSYLICMHLF